MDFRKNYLVKTDKELEYFNKNSSQRNFESCKKEIEKLEEYALDNKISNFDYAILSDCDKIFNPVHQREYFKEKYKSLKNAAHNVFYYFRNFDDILNF